MTVDVFKLPVFPAADVFPMMAPDELQELAADIKENGLREPIVYAEIPIKGEDGEPALDDKGRLVTQTQLIDGRNRREACRLADIPTPLARKHKFEFVPDVPEGQKPKPADTTPKRQFEQIRAKAEAFVISANNRRRHMTNDARIMAEAIIHPEPAKPGRGKRLEIYNQLEAAGMDRAYAKVRMSDARLIAQYAPISGREVVAGTIPFDAALKLARQAQRADQAATEEREKAEAIAKERAGRLDALRVRHLDLAKQVDDGRKLEDAEREGADRDRARAESKRTALNLIGSAIDALSKFRSQNLQESLRDLHRDDDFIVALIPYAQRIRELEAGIAALLSFMEDA